MTWKQFKQKVEQAGGKDAMEMLFYIDSQEPDNFRISKSYIKPTIVISDDPIQYQTPGFDRQ